MAETEEVFVASDIEVNDLKGTKFLSYGLPSYLEWFVRIDSSWSRKEVISPNTRNTDHGFVKVVIVRDAFSGIEHCLECEVSNVSLS